MASHPNIGLTSGFRVSNCSTTKLKGICRSFFLGLPIRTNCTTGGLGSAQKKLFRVSLTPLCSRWKSRQISVNLTVVISPGRVPSTCCLSRKRVFLRERKRTYSSTDITSRNSRSQRRIVDAVARISMKRQKRLLHTALRIARFLVPKLQQRNARHYQMIFGRKRIYASVTLIPVASQVRHR